MHVIYDLVCMYKREYLRIFERRAIPAMPALL